MLILRFNTVTECSAFLNGTLSILYSFKSYHNLPQSKDGQFLDAEVQV